jgi:hypothetical protein
MRKPHPVTVRSLRLAYKAAVAAHSNWARAVVRATRRGEKPPTELLEEERKARQVMDSAREELNAARRARAERRGEDFTRT